MDELQSIVEDINARYDSLKLLSNDSLRERLRAIEYQISNSEDHRKEMDTFLPEVYAIMKDTARRFSEGNVMVSACENDVLLAEETDFVQIEGDKAIYRNKWDAAGQPFVWNMIHYDEQLKGGILLHQGYAVEMATGEGKTLVATLPVFLNALTHRGVHLMTVNSYLSKRDYEITRPLYMFHGLSVSCIEYYDHSEFGRKRAYKANITFGTNSSFTFDYLFDHLALTPNECVQTNHNFAIVDELDSILIDEANTPHIIGGGNHYDNSKVYKDNFPLVKELVNDERLYTKDSHKLTVSFTSEGKEWLAHRTGVENLFSIQRTYEIEDFDQLPIEEEKVIINKLNLQNALYQILRALTLFEKDVHYIVDEGKVKIIDENTGRIKENNRWEHGLHTAVEVKEGVKTQPDFDGLAVISLKNYFKLYNKVCGMSGTIMPVEEELAETYGLKCAPLPSHKPCVREDLPLQIFKTSEEKDCQIANCISDNCLHGRPSLVGCISIKRSEALCELLEKRGLVFNKLNAKTEKDEAHIIGKAGIGNTITVSTSMAGRGTDIKPSQDVLDHGGLVVVGADLFDSIRVDRQLRGRTGRQGNPGTSIFFASLEDFLLKHLTSDEKDELDKLVKEVEDNDYNKPAIRAYFEKAQQNLETLLKAQRKESNRKDDIIAPHRLKFYNQRNQVLFDAHVSERIFSDIFEHSSHSLGEAHSHLGQLYSKTKELVKRSRWNNSIRNMIYVPFSDDLHTFAIQLDTELVIRSYDYFCREYERQIILQVYDKMWKRFVIHVMGNLDSHEIEMLSEKYDRMMSEINSILISRMLNSTIPFDAHNSNRHNEIENGRHAYKTINEVKPDDPCPCGSNKKYCECHGVNTHSIKGKRRR